MRISLSGHYRDTIRGADDGLALYRGPRRSNVVVYRALDLIAGLLSNQRTLRGITYWAVGSGDPAWDNNPLAPDRTARALVNETYRKRVDPARDIRYDPQSRIVTVRLNLEADEAPGTLREFGLFGGDASARPGSGYLINHAIHPVIEKTDDAVLERDLELSFSAEGALQSLLDLIARLMSNEPALAGIQYVAAGAGDPSWNGSPPAVAPDARRLVAEIYREAVRPASDIAYIDDVRTLVVRAAIGFGEATGVLREFALFGGDSTNAPDSGRLVSYQTEPEFDHTRPTVLDREFRIILGSDVVIAVPDVIGQPVAEAQTALLTAGLTPGALQMVESDAAPGSVVVQSPTSASLVAEGSLVGLAVAAVARVELPDLRGLMAAEAGAVLAAAGLLLSDMEPATEENPARPGTVVRQSPEAGERVEPASVVSIVLARSVTVDVPELAGLTPGAAEVLLHKAGLALAPPPFPVTGSGQTYDTVIEQEPQAGERVTVGSPVTITLAAPWSLATPSLLDLTTDAAVTVLREAAAQLLASLDLPPDPPGLVLGSQILVESDRPAGTIIAQSPAPDEIAPLFGTVDISLAITVTVVVPDLAGMTEQQAAGALEAAGLSLLRTTSRLDVAVAGTVVEHQPRSGDRVARGSAVTLTLAESILVDVPQVVERTLAYAEEVVASRSLILNVTARRMSEQPLDTILEQVPPAGQQVAIQTSVGVVVAARVPNLVGLTPEAAEPALAAVGLALAAGPHQQEVSAQPVGTILRQTPEAGVVADAGSSVAIVVAALVPNVVGMNLDQAGAALVAVGLQLALPATSEPSDQPAGTIISQQPLSGQAATVGDAVNVVVAVAATVAVPSVLALALAQAQASIQAAGLTPVVGEERPSSAPAGTVIDQTPVAGTQVSPGSSVTIIVAIPQPVNQIVGALGGDPDRLYIHATGMLAARHVLEALYDGPFDRRHFEYQPVILAEAPEIAIDTTQVPVGARMVRNGQVVISSQATEAQQMRVTFRMREGLTWDDGQPVSAKDSVFSFQMASTSATPISTLRVVRTEDYSAVDELTIVWTGLPGWTDAAPFLNFWTPLPQHLLDGLAPEDIVNGDFSRRPASYGPYQLLDWAEGDRLLLRRHPVYFRADDGLPRADTIDLRVALESREVFDRLLAGDLDMALTGSLSVDLLPDLTAAAGEGRIDLHVEMGTGVEYLMLCLDRVRTPFFLDVRVRQAIAHAIDRQRIVDELLGGSTKVANSFVPLVHPAHLEDLPHYQFDPDAARALLAEAGFPDGFAVSLLVPAGRPDRDKLAEAIVGFLADIGINVEARRAAPAKLFAKGKDTPLFGRQFEMALFSWDGGIEPPAELFLSEEAPDEANGWGAMNLSGFRDKRFDAIALQAMSTPDVERQRSLWLKAQEIFAETLPSIPLFHVVKLAATRPGLQGFALDASQPSEMSDVERFER